MKKLLFIGLMFFSMPAFATLTQNYIPVASTSSPSPNIISSVMYQTGGNVGINSTAPGQAVDVQGTVRATQFLGTSADISANLITTPLAISTSTNLVSGDRWNVVTASGALTETLPAPAVNEIVSIRVAPTSTNLVTVHDNASELIDGLATRIMWAGESAVLQSDGTNWFKIAGKTIPMVCVVYMYNSGADFNVLNATVTLVPIDTTATDNTGLMANLGSNAIKIVRAGNYFVQAGVGYDLLSSQSVRVLSAYGINGTSSPYIGEGEGYGASGGYPGILSTNINNYTVGQVISSITYQSSGSTQHLYSFVGETQANNYILATEIPSW